LALIGLKVTSYITRAHAGSHFSACRHWLDKASTMMVTVWHLS